MKLSPLLLVLLIAPGLLISLPLAAQQQRPSAMRLFPHETLAFARVAHGRELYERFRTTGFGTMLEDPGVAPLLQGSWQLAGEQFTESAAEQVGMEWDDLSRVPKGEIAIGVIDRGKADMGVLVLADFDGEQADVDFFLERFDERWAAEGMVVEQNDVEGDQLIIVRRGDDRSSSFGYLVKQTCLIGSNDETLLRHVLDRWAGRPPMVELATAEQDTPTDDSTDSEASTEPLPGERTLAENTNFQTILRECSTQLEEPPQVLMYVDPVALIRRAYRGNAGASIALATFPALGLDGMLGVGGTLTLATEKWDSVAHLHLLLDNPRSGVLTLLRFESGDITPPNYVPANAYGYTTTYLDAPGIYDRLTQLVDRFRYEGAFDETIETNISERLGIDFKQVFINNLSGRATLVTTYDEPRRPQGGQRAVALSLVSPELAEQALAKVAEQFSERLEERKLGGVTYYILVPRFLRDRPEEERPFSPSLAVVDGNLIASSSASVLQMMIETQQGSRSRLADAIEYKVIQSRVERLTRGQKLALFYYENSAEALRHWYEVSQSDRAREGLADVSERSSLAGGFLDLLEQHELPPVDQLQQYLAPTGGYLLDTNTGLHFMSFKVRGAEAP